MSTRFFCCPVWWMWRRKLFHHALCPASTWLGACSPHTRGWGRPFGGWSEQPLLRPCESSRGVSWRKRPKTINSTENYGIVPSTSCHRNVVLSKARADLWWQIAVAGAGELLKRLSTHITATERLGGHHSTMWGERLSDGCADRGRLLINLQIKNPWLQPLITCTFSQKINFECNGW